MTPPKFSVGERVRVRSVEHPEFNCDFALIDGMRWCEAHEIYEHAGVIHQASGAGWQYSLIGFLRDAMQGVLHPIPDDDEGLAEFMSQLTRKQAEPA